MKESYIKNKKRRKGLMKGPEERKVRKRKEARNETVNEGFCKLRKNRRQKSPEDLQRKEEGKDRREKS